MRRYAIAGYRGRHHVKTVFVTLENEAQARALIRRKIARMQRPDLDFLVFECALEPCDKIEQTRDFHRWARREIARRKPAKLFPDEC